MRNRKWKNGGERINIVWPVLVCGLALLFAVLSTSTILSMNQDLSALYEYPYLNAQHINRAANAVSLMRQGMNRLAIRRGAKDYAAVRTLVEEAMPELEESLDYIAGHYLGPAEDVDVRLMKRRSAARSSSCWSMRNTRLRRQNGCWRRSWRPCMTSSWRTPTSSWCGAPQPCGRWIGSPTIPPERS